MTASVAIGYGLVALAVIGVLYITVFQKGPETSEEYSPRYGKAEESAADTQQR